MRTTDGRKRHDRRSTAEGRGGGGDADGDGVRVIGPWAQWFPVLVVSRPPKTCTLPVALLDMNGEPGVGFQGIRALARLTTIPVAVVFLLARRRVRPGTSEGAVRG